MALIGSLGTVRGQAAPVEKFAAAFAYLDDLFRAGSAAAERLRAQAPGETRRIELAGGAFALEQAYVAKLREEGFFESHRMFIDVQVVFEGEEWMELADIARMTVRTSYRADRDLTAYEDEAGASLLHLRAGEAAIFYPSDVHMPGLSGRG